MRSFFSTKTRFSRKFFELRIVWPWMLMRSKALIKADLLDTYNMFIRPTKNFLFASEVRLHHQNRTFSWIFHIKIACLRSISGVPNSKNQELNTFVAIKNDSYIVWPPRLFLRIALNLEKSSSATLMFQSLHKIFFTLHKTLHRAR